MTDTTDWTEVKLVAQQMLRFECTSATTIKLVEGSGELFGTELSTKGALKLHQGFLGTILTFNGCTLKYTTNTIIQFTVGFNEDQEIPNVYLNFHASLEKIRANANNDNRGPRLMVCGNESVGKTTLCRILSNYAARKYRKVILIDANVAMNDICLPGSIAALIVTKPYEIVEGWDIFEDPLIYSFGHLSPVENLKLYSLQLNNLAELVNIRSENDPDVFAGGCIINMSGVSKSDDSGESQKKGIEAIRSAISAFEVNVLIIIEDGFLENLLRKDLPDYVSVIRIPKSSGAHARTPEQWQKERSLNIAAYFHGRGVHKLQPHKLTLLAGNVRIIDFLTCIDLRLFSFSTKSSRSI